MGISEAFNQLSNKQLKEWIDRRRRPHSGTTNNNVKPQSSKSEEGKNIKPRSDEVKEEKQKEVIATKV